MLSANQLMTRLRVVCKSSNVEPWKFPSFRRLRSKKDRVFAELSQIQSASKELEYNIVSTSWESGNAIETTSGPKRKQRYCADADYTGGFLTQKWRYDLKSH